VKRQLVNRQRLQRTPGEEAHDHAAQLMTALYEDMGL